MWVSKTTIISNWNNLQNCSVLKYLCSSLFLEIYNKKKNSVVQLMQMKHSCLKNYGWDQTAFGWGTLPVKAILHPSCRELPEKSLWPFDQQFLTASQFSLYGNQLPCWAISKSNKPSPWFYTLVFYAMFLPSVTSWVGDVLDAILSAYIVKAAHTNDRYITVPGTLQL